MTASAKEFWEKAYQDNFGRLIGICYRYTKNYPLSEDLAHDAFLKAIDKAGTFKATGQFEAWLRRIVVNHTLQYLRDRKKDPPVVDSMPDLIAPETIEENSHPSKSMSFTIPELIDTIDQLPEHHRLVFNLYVLEEFTHAQIGDELGISEGTSKSHLARARKKLKQLLTEKAAGDQQDKERKKYLILLLTSDAGETLDKVFRDGFHDFSIPPRHPLSLESVQFNSQHPLSSKSFLKANVKLLATSAVVTSILIVVWVVNRTHNPTQTVSVIEKTSSDSTEKNPAHVPSSTATISSDSIILKTKQKQMKPLDSLALMLVLSSGTVPTISAKDSIKNEIQKSSLVVTVPNAVQKERGTFSATELYWSKENSEVYFKGQVRVNFKEQHFQGTGSFTFLGKIEVLVVDGQQISLGTTLKLVDGDYELVVLNSKEAVEKYGDKGVHGAVEISRTQ